MPVIVRSLRSRSVAFQAMALLGWPGVAGVPVSGGDRSVGRRRWAYAPGPASALIGAPVLAAPPSRSGRLPTGRSPSGNAPALPRSTDSSRLCHVTSSSTLCHRLRRHCPRGCPRGVLRLRSPVHGGVLQVSPGRPRRCPRAVLSRVRASRLRALRRAPSGPPEDGGQALTFSRASASNWARSPPDGFHRLPDDLGRCAPVVAIGDPGDHAALGQGGELAVDPGAHESGLLPEQPRRRALRGSGGQGSWAKRCLRWVISAARAPSGGGAGGERARRARRPAPSRCGPRPARGCRC